MTYTGNWEQIQEISRLRGNKGAAPLTVHQLKPAWSRVFLCRYILRLKARIRELEAELAERG